GGLIDTRLGTVEPGLRCKTCGGRVKECPGHFGHIELVRPVVHVEFAKHIYYILKSTCPACHRLLSDSVAPAKVEVIEKEAEGAEVTAAPVAKGEAGKDLAKMKPADAKDEKIFTLFEEDEGKAGTAVAVPEKKDLEKEMKKRVKEKKQCPHCGAEVVEIKMLKPTGYYKGKDTLLPTEVREWLAAIPDSDLTKLGFNAKYARPEWMIITVLPVPPVNVRPSITLETGERSEDDLTHKLVDIIRINQKLEANINAGAPQLIIEDLWELLQYHITTYFDNETANIPPARHRSGRPLKTLAQRLKGKEGRFRYNLSGKRVNFSARTVISPDPRISLNEVGVPQEIAEEMTIPVAVTEWNVEECKKYMSSDTYPRAIYVIRNDGRRLKITEISRKEILENVKIGWTIERQLIDGDIAMFNRQPSLHRVSMMGHTVHVLPGKTFRLNPVVTTPYNADFDGDEMNLHVPQTDEAMAEVRYLMKVEKQILSPRHGHAIIKPTEDHISGIYFLTRSDMKFSKEETMRLLYLAGMDELPEPDLKNGEFSGRLVFSQLLPKDLNVKAKSRLGEDVVIKDGKLTKGTLDNKIMESEILEQIYMQHGPEYTGKFIDNVTRLGLEVLTLHGLSVSLRNYALSDKGAKKVLEIHDKMDREIDNLILQYRNKTLELAPGMTFKETLENSIVGITSKTRDEIGRAVSEDLGESNPSIIMANIGARGSLLNAIQMSATVAQQVVRSKRPIRGYKGRSLPFFKRKMLTGKERGFVYSSFRKGLTPYEFFHHSMGGREALVNTAIRTARSGYMQRRLINALQDLIVAPDKSVRDADMSLVQFIYGGDAKDPVYATKAEAMDSVKQDDVDTA
ncbi:MAG: DNA-directed RNA polymerase subunit A', partial [Candidatus Bilamarchaeaceae archaeon]